MSAAGNISGAVAKLERRLLNKAACLVDAPDRSAPQNVTQSGM